MTVKTDIGLQRAIEAAKTGENLAAILGITPQAVSQWKRIPHARVLSIEERTGVPRYVQRPDVYPPPNGRKTPAADSRADRASGSDQRPTHETARSLEPSESGASAADGGVESETSLQHPSNVAPSGAELNFSVVAKVS